MSYRLRNIAIALALAVFAAVLTSFYVNQYKENVQANQKLTTVWVAEKDIPVGTSGAEAANLLTETQVAKENVAPGAIVKPSDLNGKVLTEKVYAGEQVTLRRFKAPSQQGIRAKIAGTLRAVQVAGDEHQLLAGTLRDGDRVDVVGTWKFVDGKDWHVTRVVLRDLLVLRAPHTASDQSLASEGGNRSKAIVLAVTDAQSQKLFWVTSNGKWSLALRPTEDPADSPESLEWSETILADGLTQQQLLKLLNPFAERRVAGNG